ncbi:hypothetical protein Pmani_006715 [Petrolisthes manimaculis]|uniref:Ferritin n=1 Tax=Petrolisthes manimaculis TaxID=1843537 RepID=A0AAE1ULH0_9EUCA|nr:hypothetical protein Pmani_006715 [Petrolisthes manimaculis]
MASQVRINYHEDCEASINKQINMELYASYVYISMYQNKRGGRIVLQAIAAPSLQEWGNSHDALQAALDLERKVNQSLLDLHATAGRNNDPHLSEMLEDEILKEQVDSIKKIGDMITRLKRAGTSGLGEYMFNKENQ